MESSAPACTRVLVEIHQEGPPGFITRSPTRQEVHLFYGSVSSVRLCMTTVPKGTTAFRHRRTVAALPPSTRLHRGFLPSRGRFLRELPRPLLSLLLCPAVRVSAHEPYIELHQSSPHHRPSHNIHPANLPSPDYPHRHMVPRRDRLLRDVCPGRCPSRPLLSSRQSLPVMLDSSSRRSLRVLLLVSTKMTE
jgi:hypothetical protein